MSSVQVGNGWLDTERGTYTTYNAQTGQLLTRTLDRTKRTDVTKLVADAQAGRVDINQFLVTADKMEMGGRSNVNIGGQVGQVTFKIMQQYPQMTKEMAMRYANKWVTDRIARGNDANEIEDFAKGALRDDKALGDEMYKGINDMISRDEFAGTPDDATGASMGPDPRQSIQDELREFAGRMMTTVGPDSPQAKRISELAAAAGNKYATSSGMGPGGLTATGVGGVAARAHTDLQTQREGIGLQALAAAGNQQLTVDQAQTALQAQNQQANAMNSQGIGGLIGSGAGLIGGIVATAYSGGSAAPAIPGLVAAGGAAGSAVGGIVGNQGPAVTYGGGQRGGKSSYRGGSSGSS